MLLKYNLRVRQAQKHKILRSGISEIHHVVVQRKLMLILNNFYLFAEKQVLFDTDQLPGKVVRVEQLQRGVYQFLKQGSFTDIIDLINVRGLRGGSQVIVAGPQFINQADIQGLSAIPVFPRRHFLNIHARAVGMDEFLE